MLFLCDDLFNQRQLISCKGRIPRCLDIVQDLLRAGGPRPVRWPRRRRDRKTISLCDFLISGVNVLINSLTVAGDAQFVIALWESIPKRVSNKIVNSGLCLLFVRPMVKLRDPGLDLLQKIDRHLFNFLDIPLGKIFREQQIVEG